jgi:hypothetical protein
MTLSVGSLRQTTPVQVGAICGIRPTGELLCWGSNSSGALGDGTTTPRGTPMPVGSSTRFVQVTVGEDYACALSGRGETWCWGSNTNGQLGNGTTIASPSPVRVPGPRLVSISAGYTTTCGIDITGDAWCWGRDLFNGPDVLAPVRVPGGVKFRSLSVGSSSFACGITTSGQAVCGGISVSGQLGTGVLADTATAPKPVVGINGSVVSISSGLATTCALTALGDLYCWGNNAFGTLGIGVQNSSPVASRVNLAGQAVGSPASIGFASSIANLFGAVGLAFGGVVVRVTDANGFGTPGVPVTVAPVSGGGSGGTPPPTNAAGFTTVGAVLGTTPGPNVFRISVASNPSVTTTFTVAGRVPGPPARVFCNLGCTAQTVAGTTYNFATNLPSFQVLDSINLPVPNVAITVSGNRPGIVTSPALPATLFTPLSGFTTLNTWTADTVARTDTLTVTVAGLPPAFLVLRAVPAAPQRVIVFSAGQLTGVQAGAIVGPIVTHLRDRYQNLATNAAATPVTLSLQSGPPGGTLGGTTTVTAVAGVATFSNITFSIPGNYVMAVNAPGLTGSAIAWQVIP